MIGSDSDTAAKDAALTDAATTRALIKAGAVIGIKGVYVTTAAGAILPFTPFATGSGQATVDFLNSWGPGRFDVRSLPDNVLDDGVANPTAYPPIWNMVDLEEQGYTIGWDGLFQSSSANNGLASISEAVYDLVMHANGAFGTGSGAPCPQS